MVLQLQPGERTETRGMPVAELNGQKGTIVCYMESNGRYLLELDDTGKTLSLRKDNLKTEDESETETETETKIDSGAPEIEKVEDEDDDLQDPIEQMPRASAVKPKDEDDVLQDPIKLFPRTSSAKPEAKSTTTRTTNTTEEIIEAEIEKAKGMKISELRMKLIAKGIEVSDFLEKQDMIWAYAKAVAKESKSEKVHEEEVHDRIYHINDLVWYNRVDGTRSRALVAEGRYVGDRPTYHIRILSSGVSKTTTGKWLTLITSSSQNRRPAIREPNLFESLLLKVYDTVSWPTLAVGLLAIMWMWPDGSSSSHYESPGSTRHGRDESYYNHYNSYWRWHWSPFYFGYWNCWCIVGGLGSVLLAGLFTHKLGTNNGSRKFNWNRAWNALLQMDFWELIRLVAIFEGALYFLGGIAGGGRRRRY